MGALDHWHYADLRNRTYVARVVALGVLYFSTATLGLSLDAVSGVAAAVWPPTGIALAALLLGGYRRDHRGHQRVRIGTMDLTIAASALGHNALVLSGNLRDFQQVPGLDVEDWRQ